MFNIIGILPLVLGWVACYCLARELAARQVVQADRRLSCAFASVAWGALLTFMLELGSLGRLLTAPMLWSAWVLINAALFLLAVSLARKRGVRISEAPRAAWQHFQASFTQWPVDARCYVSVTAGFVVLLFGIAITFATTNWDSLNYHMPRIMHWIQAASIEHFPTNNSRQIEFAPWQSFLSMTLYLLWGGDRLLNLVQWCAMLGSLVLVTYMVKALAFHNDDAPPARRHLLTSLALVVAVTVPIGLVESMNPQNDYTATFWLCCLACFALALFREPANPWYMLGAGLACGLGTLTKSTTYVYAAPLILGFGAWWIFRRFSLQIKLRHAAIFCCVFFVINAGHAIRNQGVFGSPLGSPHIFALEKNKPMSVSGTAANVVRNLFLHSASGVAPVTTALQRVLVEAHELTGRGFVDSETTYRGKFYISPEFFIFDSFAAGTWHMLLIFATLIVAACKPKRFQSALWHSAWVIASFILFCAYLKWQYNHSRFHLAYFILLSPVIVIVLGNCLPRWSLAVISAVLVCFGGYSLAKNASRPFFNADFQKLPRQYQFLTIHGQHLNQPTSQLADAIVISGATNVGLKLLFDDAEYPLWAMLRERGFRGTLQHVNVENESAHITPIYQAPPVIVTTSRKHATVLATNYPFSVSFGDLRLLSRTPLKPSGAEEFSQNK